MSAAFLKKKQLSEDDPLTGYGIMTLNNHIPYRKPILKDCPLFVNAKGVMREIEKHHGGLYFTKGQSKDPEEIKK